MGDRSGGGTQAVAVAAFGKQVKFCGDVGFLELKEPGYRVLDVDRVIFGLQQESWWRVAGGMEIRIEAEGDAGFSVRLRHNRREIAGIDDDGEVRAR